MKIDRDAVAKAFGWASWAQLVDDSHRDGYTEAGGRGALAAAISRNASTAGALVELLYLHDEARHETVPPCPPNWERMEPRAIWDALKGAPKVAGPWLGEPGRPGDRRELPDGRFIVRWDCACQDGAYELGVGGPRLPDRQAADKALCAAGILLADHVADPTLVPS